jgi:NAD(P)-dependent dehydrogenase (short-subunit alcohol dehydrogenase family)
MNDRLAVLVTGGASGIGRATVEGFLADGWNVVAADLNAESGEELVAALSSREYRGRVDFVRTDVSIESDIEAAVLAVPERHGRLDCVVNNAGVGGAFGPITEIEVEDWDYTFAVITRGVFLGIKHAARTMQKLGTPGSIINTAPSVICFLAGEGAGFITGEAINVDGGVIAAGPRIGDKVGGDPAARGLVGVARGNTGQKSVVRHRLKAPSEGA